MPLDNASAFGVARADTGTAHAVAPILRYGQLVSGEQKSKTDHPRFVFEGRKMNEGINALKNRAEIFAEAIARYLGTQSNFDDGAWTVTQLKPNAGVRAVRKLGAVVDFPELRIEKNEQIIILRPSITVCVDKYGDLEAFRDSAECQNEIGVCFLPETSELSLFSKIWIRSSVVKLDGQNASSVSAETFMRFTKNFEELSRRLVNQLHNPYKHVLAELAHLPVDDISVNMEGELVNLIVSSEHDGLRRLHDEIDLRTFEFENCGSLKRSGYEPLFNAYFDALNETDPGRAEKIGCKELFSFQDDFTKGVFAIHRVGKTTRIFGAAHSPFWKMSDKKDAPVEESWKMSPGHTLGALAMTSIASRL